jgi:hypothetical protein
MPVELSILGAERLELVGARLKQTGNGDLRKALLKGLRAAAKPMLQVAQDAARDKLPRSGGLNEFVAASKFSTTSKLTGKNPSVSLKATKKGHDVKATDRGVLRHPVFGHNVWVQQTIPAGWFSQSLEEKSEIPRKELHKVLEDVAEELARG